MSDASNGANHLLDEQALREDNYVLIRFLPDNRAIALYQMMFTTALCVLRPGYFSATRDADGNINALDNHRETRYCYEHFNDAVKAVAHWDGTGDPPGPWVKQKPEDRLNPALARDDFETNE